MPFEAPAMPNPCSMFAVKNILKGSVPVVKPRAISSEPHILTESHFPTFIAVQLRPNIQIEAQFSRASVSSQPGRVTIAARSFPLVEINDIFNALSIAALNNPVMTIEGQLISEDSVKSSPGAQELRINSESTK